MNFVWAVLGSKIGQGAIIGLGALIALWVYGIKKESDGYDRCKIEWDAAIEAAAQQGAQARTDAESSISGDTSDERVRNDPRNRDR